MTKDHNRKIIVVLDAGRCGTSLMMEVLKGLGMSSSVNFIQSKGQKPCGFNEDGDLAKVYEELLLKIGSTRALPISTDCISDDIKRHTQSQLENITKKNLASCRSIWGFNDPFTSCLLPIWFPVFNLTKVVPIFIVVVRNPAEATASMKKNIGIAESLAELAWLLHYTEALYNTSSDCYIAHHEDWFTQGEEIAEDLLKYTGLEDYFPGKRVDEALKPVLDYNSDQSLYADYEVQNDYVTKLYETLRNCRGNKFDRAKLMRVVKECRKAMHGFRGWYENVQEILKLQNSQYENPVSRDVMKSDMEKLVIENNRLLMENKDLMDELENSRLRMASSSYEQVKSNQKWNEEAIILRNSYSFRLGQIFVNAVNRPGKDTLLMPYYLLRFFWEIVSGRGRKNVSTSSKQWLN